GRSIDGETRCAVGKGNAFREGGIGINLRRGDADVVSFKASFKGFDALMDGGRLEEDFGRAAPNHHHAIDGLLEGLNVGDELIGKVALVLASFDVSAV